MYTIVYVSFSLHTFVIKQIEGNGPREATS